MKIQNILLYIYFEFRELQMVFLVGKYADCGFNVNNTPRGRGNWFGQSTIPSTVTASSPRLELPTPVLQCVHQETPSEAHSVQIQDGSGRSDQSRPEWRQYTEPKIPQYQMSEDIENDLVHFEHITKTWSPLVLFFLGDLK